RREKATSNICTAQVLLAVMASMYAVYHGPEGLVRIASRVTRLTAILKAGLLQLGFTASRHEGAFDTIALETGDRTDAIAAPAVSIGASLRKPWGRFLYTSLDAASSRAHGELLWRSFGGDDAVLPDIEAVDASTPELVPAALRRTSRFMTHPVFNS